MMEGTVVNKTRTVLYAETAPVTLTLILKSKLASWSKMELGSIVFERKPTSWHRKWSEILPMKRPVMPFVWICYQTSIHGSGSPA